MAYRWSYSTNGGASFVAIAGAAGAGADLAASTIIISGNTTVRRTAYATITGTNLLCDAVSDDVTFTVTARTPAISSAENSGTVNDNIICTGAAVTFTATVAGGVAADTIAWLVDGVTPAVDPGDVLVYSPTNLTTGQAVRYTVTTNAAAGSCVFTSAPITITVLDPPVATLTSDKSVDSICSGDSIIFTAGPAGQANYEFFIAGVSKQSGAAITFTTTEITQDRAVRVVVTNAGGCTDDDTVSVQVADATVPGFIAIDTTGDNSGDAITQVLCASAGNTLIDGDTALGALGVAATSSNQVAYRWSYSTNGGASFVAIAGAAGAGADLAASTIIISGNTTVRRTAYATITGTNLLCDAVSDDVTFTVTARTPAISSAENSGTVNDNIICTGAAVTFTATVAGGVAADTIAWLVDGVTPAVDPGDVLVYSPTNLTTGQAVRYTVTTNAAAGSCVFTSAPITITVLDPPVATLTSDKSVDSICSGDSIIFTAGPAGQANYEFFIAGVSKQSGAAITFTTTEITQDRAVRVVVTNAGGCTDDDTVSVQVADATVPGFIAIDTTGDNSGDAITQVLCASAGNTLIDGDTALGALGVAATSSNQVAYRWSYSTNGGASFVAIAGAAGAGADLAASTIIISGNTTVRRTAYATITGTNLLCDAVSDDVTFTVTARTPAISSAENSGTVNDNIICTGAAVTFTATVAGGVAADTIAWLVDGVTPAVDPGDVLVYSPTNLTTGQAVRYTVTTNAAAGSCVFTSAPITITVLDPPVATLTSDKSVDSICSGDSIIFTAGPAGQANYEFFIAGVSKQSGAAITFTTTEITQDRAVRVVVTNAGGCTDDDTVSVQVADATVPGFIAIDTTGDNSGDAITQVLCASAGNTLIDGDTALGALGVAATSSNQVAYRWSYSTNGGASFVAIAGAAGAGADLAASTIIISGNTTVRRTAYATITGTNLLCDAVSDDVTFTVTARTPAISSAENSGTVNDNIICTGAAVTFTATVAGGVAADTIAWLVDGVTPAVDPGDVLVYSPTNLTTGQAVRYTVTTNAAAGSCVFTSAPITITVLDPPVATLTSDKSVDSICSGDSIIFTAGPAGQANYEFFIGAGIPLTANVLGGNTFSTDDFSVTDSDLQFVVTVRITNAAGRLDESVTIFMNYVRDTGVSITGPVMTQNICSGTAPSIFIATSAADLGDGTTDWNDGADKPGAAALTYQWQSRVAPGGWLDIDGATTRTNYQAPNLFQTTEFRRNSISTLRGKVCTQSSSGIITINVAATLTGGQVERNTGGVTFVDATQILCPGDIPQLLRVVGATPAAADISFQWEFSADSVLLGTRFSLQIHLLQPT